MTAAADMNALAAICEAVPEQDEPPLIYVASPQGRDEVFGYADSHDPVKALESLAQREGITDYSIDTDDLRVVLCPRMMRRTFYIYR